MTNDFKQIDLHSSQYDPNTFAGYLPHTISLKDIHIYVEGPSDVYIYQIFLLKYLKKHIHNWAQMYNRVGIYHLGGDYWSHLLYTIPNYPYRCYVILDGDKKIILDKMKPSLEKRFEIIKDLNELPLPNNMNIPIYTLNNK